MPVSYSNTSLGDWKEFAELILKGAYYGTLSAAAILSKKQNKTIKVYLTCLGGGAFGNETIWIENAIKYAINQHLYYPLHIYLVHYGSLPSDNSFQIEIPNTK